MLAVQLKRRKQIEILAYHIIYIYMKFSGKGGGGQQYRSECYNPLRRNLQQLSYSLNSSRGIYRRFYKGVF